MQDCMDGSGLQFIKFDLVTGGQEIKLAVLGFLSRCFVFYKFSRYFVGFIMFGIFFLPISR